ncbi:TPA: hypothetical protein MW256_003649, partial [Acinetobacter baumannii]|nr:hypothetical protein [Acinetobacter baumannii]
DLERISKEFFSETSFIVNPEVSYFHQYCLLHHKLIQPRPRKVIFSKKFCVPVLLEKGLTKLINKLEQGQDVNGYLSKSSINMTKEDGLLNDFGIYHFHLGINYDGNFISRTKEVAFAYINTDTVFFIEAPAHGYSNDVDKLLWFRARYINIIHDEQPHLIERYRVNGIPAIEVDDQTRKKLRRSNVNTFIPIDDTTSYVSMGFGSVASGMSAKAIIQANEINNEIACYVLDVKKYIKDNISFKIVSDNLKFTIKLINFDGELGKLNTEFELWLGNDITHKISYLYKTENSRRLSILAVHQNV